MTSSLRLQTSQRWTLERALGDADVQREIIHEGAASLAALEPDDAGLLFGSKAEKPVAPPRNLTVAQLLRRSPEPTDLCRSVAGYFQSVAIHENNPLVLTWSTLVMMVLFRECAQAVAKASDPVFAPWFDGDHAVLPLEQRFEQHIGGGKSKLANTGVLAVVEEWQLLARFAPFKHVY